MKLENVAGGVSPVPTKDRSIDREGGSRRGISRLLSEILMVSAVMSIGSLVYVYSVTVASEAHHPDISIAMADAVLWRGGTIVQASVRNIGMVPLKLTSATASGEGELRTWNAGAELNVGHEYGLRFTMGRRSVGATVTLVVSAVDSRGAEVKAAASVTVRQP